MNKRAKIEESHHIVSVACVVRRNNKYLFCKREDNGLWELPGGRVEDKEELKSAALRELTEETGLVASDARLRAIWHFDLHFEQKNIGVYQVIGKITGEITPSWETPELAFIDLKQREVKIPLYVQNLLYSLNNYGLQYVEAGPFDLETAIRYIYGKIKRGLRKILKPMTNSF